MVLVHGVSSLLINVVPLFRSHVSSVKLGLSLTGHIATLDAALVWKDSSEGADAPISAGARGCERWRPLRAKWPTAGRPSEVSSPHRSLKRNSVTPAKTGVQLKIGWEVNKMDAGPGSSPGPALGRHEVRKADCASTGSAISLSCRPKSSQLLSTLRL